MFFFFLMGGSPIFCTSRIQRTFLPTEPSSSDPPPRGFCTCCFPLARCAWPWCFGTRSWRISCFCAPARRRKSRRTENPKGKNKKRGFRWRAKCALLLFCGGQCNCSSWSSCNLLLLGSFCVHLAFLSFLLLALLIRFWLCVGFFEGIRFSHGLLLCVGPFRSGRGNMSHPVATASRDSAFDQRTGWDGRFWEQCSEDLGARTSGNRYTKVNTLRLRTSQFKKVLS